MRAPRGPGRATGGRRCAPGRGRITGTWPDDADVFAYFNNDQHGAAVRDAEAFTAATKPKPTRPSARHS